MAGNGREMGEVVSLPGTVCPDHAYSAIFRIATLRRSVEPHRRFCETSADPLFRLIWHSTSFAD